MPTHDCTQRLLALFGGTAPVLNAPMAGVTTPAMAAAVCQSGGLGVLAGDFLSPEELAREIAQVRRLTDRPFAVNLRVRDKQGKSQFFDGPEERKKAQAIQRALGDLAVDLGLPEHYAAFDLPDFDAQLSAVIECRVPVVCVAFGGLRETYADALKAAGIAVIGAATSLREAKVMRSAGVDALIVQGAEAGGPRLNFEKSDEASLVGLMSLIGPAARATGLPVVAAGGIMTGAQAAAALAAGAAGIMLGTALVRSDESAAHPAHKAQLPYVDDTGTVLTRVFSGRLTRVIENGLVQALREAGLQDAGYPNTWCAMAPILAVARAADRADLLELAAGQGAQLARTGAARTIIEHLWQQCQTLRENQQ
ncbi:MAG: NAD(P)H-dependent flavin oxidoreductase [Duodenibacillus sp.]